MTAGVYQNAYDQRRVIGLPGQVSSEERTNRISRTVESAAGIAFGQPGFRGSNDNGVAVGAVFAATAVAAAVAGNTGNGTVTVPVVTAGGKEGVYAVLMIEPGTNVGTFQVTDPDGVFVGRGTVAVPFSAGGVAFTVNDGTTDFISGDAFTITTTFTANADFLGIAILNPAVPPNSLVPDSYPQYFTGAFLTMGPIYVTSGGAAIPGDDVYWNPATKKYTNNTAHVRIPGAKFEMTCVLDAIVEISLKLR